MSDKFATGRGASTNLLKNSSLVVGARMSGAFVGIFTQILLAKFLSASDIGLFFVATSLAAVLSIVCTLGYPMLMPKIAAEAHETAAPTLLRSFVSQGRFDAALLCTLAISGLLLISISLSGASNVSGTALVFAALSLPAFSLLRLNGSLANAQRRFMLGFVPDLCVRPALLLCFILLLWALFPVVSIVTVLAGQVVIAMGLAIWQMWRLGVGLKSDTLAPEANIGKGVRDDWRRRAAPLVIAALFIGVFADMGIVFASPFLSGPQLGVFGVCLKIALFAGFGIQVVHQLILRDIADVLRADDTRSAHGVFARANILALTGSAVSAAVILIAGREVLGFFGDEFVSGYECLVLLMLAQVVRAAAGPATQVLTLSGHEKACIPVFVVSLIVMAASNAALVPFWGLLGAAASVLLVSALWSFWLAILAYRRLGLNTAVLVVSR